MHNMLIYMYYMLYAIYTLRVMISIRIPNKYDRNKETEKKRKKTKNTLIPGRVPTRY